MKTRSWILMLLITALFCAVPGIFLLKPGEAALTAEVYSQGKLLKTVSLMQDQVFNVPGPEHGFNEITVKDGKIAVTSASCPDHHCMKRGFCCSGAPVICLPNSLEIRFVASSAPDITLS